jgi:broad specificity phosphatase PhoE
MLNLEENVWIFVYSSVIVTARLHHKSISHQYMNETKEPQTRLRTIVVFSLLAIVFGAVIIFGYFATFSRPITTVIAVRHAEKKIEPQNQDPDLTPEGEARAKEIARMFADAGINVIYATQYKRTQETVKPLADLTGIAPTLLQANQTEELAKQIQTNHRGQTIFVAGHNNTVPALVSILSGDTYPVIPESEYDNLYIITIYRFGKAKVIKLKYGSETTQGVGNGTMVPMKPQIDK